MAEKTIRKRLVLIAPMRRLAWSANSAVAVHITATTNDMISPRYCIHYELIRGQKYEKNNYICKTHR